MSKTKAQARAKAQAAAVQPAQSPEVITAPVSPTPVVPPAPVPVEPVAPAAPAPAAPKPVAASPVTELCAALSDLVAYAAKSGPSTAPALVAAQSVLAKYAK